MKRILLFLLIILHAALATQAQWTDDPANPLQIATGNPAANQTNYVAISDSTDGYFVFWLDNRRDSTLQELYGQHINSEGYRLWSDTGKLIASNRFFPLRSVNAIMLQGGNILVAWTFGVNLGDTLMAQLLDYAGVPVWTQPMIVVGKDTSNSAETTSVDAAVLLASGNGAFIAYYLNTKVYVNRIDANGKLYHQKNGRALTFPSGEYGGHFQLVSDGKGNAFIYGTEGNNGKGAYLYVSRFDTAGTMLWKNTLNLTANTNGLSSELRVAFKGLVDNRSNLFLTWANYNEDIVLARVDASGKLSFPSGTIPVCTFSSGQQMAPDIILNNNFLYIAWQDTRVSASTSLYKVYIQKLDTAGNTLWNKDGIRVSSSNFYYPVCPKLAPASDGGAVVAYQAGPSGYGYQIQHVSPDSLLPWGNNGIQVADMDHMPNDHYHQIFFDKNGDYFLVWATVENMHHRDRYMEEVYYSKVSSEGKILSVKPAQIEQAIAAYPNPATNYLTVEAQQNSLLTDAAIFDVRCVKINMPVKMVQNQAQFDVSHQPQGLYHYLIHTSGQKIIKGSFVVVE